MRVSEIVARGHDVETVRKIERLLCDRRIQAPPVRARREGDAAQFRPRPALSDRQPLPRQRCRLRQRPTRPSPAPSARREPRRGALMRRRALAITRPMTKPVVRFAPSPTGLHPYRQCPHGAAQRAVRAAARAAPSSCASTTPTWSARGRNTPTRSSGTSPGSASPPDIVVRQSERFALYDEAAERLRVIGTALCLLRDAPTSSSSGASASSPAACRRSTTAPPSR